MNIDPNHPERYQSRCGHQCVAIFPQQDRYWLVVYRDPTIEFGNYSQSLGKDGMGLGEDRRFDLIEKPQKRYVPVFTTSSFAFPATPSRGFFEGEEEEAWDLIDEMGKGVLLAYTDPHDVNTWELIKR